MSTARKLSPRAEDLIRALDAAPMRSQIDGLLEAATKTTIREVALYYALYDGLSDLNKADLANQVADLYWDARDPQLNAAHAKSFLDEISESLEQPADEPEGVTLTIVPPIDAEPGDVLPGEEEEDAERAAAQEALDASVNDPDFPANRAEEPADEPEAVVPVITKGMLPEEIRDAMNAAKQAAAGRTRSGTGTRRSDKMVERAGQRWNPAIRFLSSEWPDGRVCEGACGKHKPTTAFFTVTRGSDPVRTNECTSCMNRRRLLANMAKEEAEKAAAAAPQITATDLQPGDEGWEPFPTETAPEAEMEAPTDA